MIVFFNQYFIFVEYSNDLRTYEIVLIVLSSIDVTDFGKLIVFAKKSFDKSTISNFISELICLFSIFLNHITTASMFLHWLTLVFSIIILFILSIYYLLTTPIPPSAGTVNMRLGLHLKFSLLSFNIMNDCFWLYSSIILTNFRSSAIAFPSVFIVCMVDKGGFFVRFAHIFSK